MHIENVSTYKAASTNSRDNVIELHNKIKGLLLPVNLLNDGHARDPVPVLPKAGP